MRKQRYTAVVDGVPLSLGLLDDEQVATVRRLVLDTSRRKAVTVFRATERAVSAAEPVDTTQLSPKAAFAHFKKTAPFEDVEFVRRVKPELSPAIDAVLAGPGTPREKASRVFAAFRMFGRPQYDVAAAERGFWRAARARRLSKKGKQFKSARAKMLSLVERASRVNRWTQSYDTPDHAYQAVRDLAHQAREYTTEVVHAA